MNDSFQGQSVATIDKERCLASADAQMRRYQAAVRSKSK
jgi:hypothetical protein